MAPNYSLQTLKLIKCLMPRRPHIPHQAFNRIKELGLLLPFRGRKKRGQKLGHSTHAIPVWAGNRDSINNNIATGVDHSNLIVIPLCTAERPSHLQRLNKIQTQPSLRGGLANCRSVRNKADVLNDVILENNLDFLGLTETWLSENEEVNKVTISSMVPKGFSFLHTPRMSRGGGVGFIYNKCFKPKCDSLPVFSSFECLMVVFTASSFTFRVIIIYRVPPSNKNKILKTAFIKELGDLLEFTATQKGKLVLLGDFNVHVDSSSDPETLQLTSLLSSFGLIQHVQGPTHIGGHTLDLVVSRSTDDVVQSCEVGDFLSDHNIINIVFRAGKPHPIRKQIKTRKIKSIDIQNFCTDLRESCLNSTESLHVDDLVSRFNAVLRALLDKHAPEKTRTVVERLSHSACWMT